MPRLRAAIVILGVLFLAGTKAKLVSAKQILSSQQAASPGQPTSSRPNPLDSGLDPSVEVRIQQQRQHMLEDDRHKRIVADTNKLLALATELKADVDKSSKNELSIAVINKAAEIEKLAHDVKERMKN